MKIDEKLTTEAERRELRYIGITRLKLQYLKDSKKKMGIQLWNVLEPQLNNYPVNGGDNGYPTLSLAGLKKEGLL